MKLEDKKVEQQSDGLYVASLVFRRGNKRFVERVGPFVTSTGAWAAAVVKVVEVCG